MNAFWRIFLIVSLSFAIIHSRAENSDRMDAEILGIMERFQGIGMSVAVVKGNRLVYTRAYGYNPVYSDTILRKSILADGVYVIQSISKSFIATAIMQLVERRKLRLEDDVSRYLSFGLRNPNYPNIPITIRMLLCHRSSINDKYYGWTFNQIDPKKGSRWRECYNDYQPGTKFSYCNLNYNLLGAIIENVTGKKFFDYIDENIVNPMGLYASFNLTKIDSTRLVRALEYDKGLKKYKKDPYIYNYTHYNNILKDYKLGSSSTACFSPSGGMKISVVDLARYMIMHMNYGKFNGKRIISKKSEKEMRKAQGKDESPTAYFSQYGLSFSRWPRIVDGESFVGITGGAHGVHSAMYFNPEKKYGFVVICNGCTSDIKMKDSVVKVLYNHFVKDN